MAPKWNFYFYRVNDALASIYLDLELVANAPVGSQPWLLWVWVDMRSPRPDGLSSEEEAETLWAIEEAFIPKVTVLCKATFCGRITTSGRREFYLYAESPEGFSESVMEALGDFPGYEFHLGKENDPAWKQYLDVLFPSPEDLQRIANRDVLDALGRHQDVSAIPRLVQHWIYFPNPEARSRFRKAASSSGFRIESESAAPVDATEFSYGISVVRIQAVVQAEIDATVIELLHLAQKFGGDYDGWESPVTTE